mmetsp:Transcript_24321/g.62356  ORF Transcript_24321/g.62356 Transcript_24321/m.62356 type:complete len:202 (-) Transcript_24321:155-760(-)
MHQQRRAQLRDAALRAAAGRGGKPERGRPEDCGRQGAVVARQHALLVRRAGGGAPCARPFAHRRRHHHHRFRRQLWAAGRGLWDGSSARGAYRRRSMCRRCSALGQRADMRGASWERWWCPRAGVGGCGAAQGGVPPRAQSVCVHAEPQGENAAGAASSPLSPPPPPSPGLDPTQSPRGADVEVQRPGGSAAGRCSACPPF